MTMAYVPQLDVPVFAGQGVTSANTVERRQIAIQDAESTSGSVLLSACFQAFRMELSQLSPEEKGMVQVSLADFPTPQCLIDNPVVLYPHNSLITGSSLFLTQILRYLSFMEPSISSASQSSIPFRSVLRQNADHGIGIAGFSSGILPACVAVTSTDIASFTFRAVEAYRLVLWIGIRCQIYRLTELGKIGEDRYASYPWSLVFIGMSKETAQEALATFSANNVDPSSSLYVTAVMDDTSVTISGRPDVLEFFAANCAGDAVVHRTTVDTLYHSPNGAAIRAYILEDVQRRQIQFPNFADIGAPLRSTFTGNALSKDSASTDPSSLLKCIVDMLLLQPVNWDLVVKGLEASLPERGALRLVNFGPGNGIVRGMVRSLPNGRVSSLDLSSNKSTVGSSKLGQDAVAIVGMAVNMPGAPDTKKLWELLENGINAISEIPEHRFKVSDYNNPNARSTRSMKAHTGNFIDNPDIFDNNFFRISPREAKSMDPQQRVLLHTAYEALEDAGYVPDATPSFRADTFGCYIGAATNDYVQNLRNDIDVYYSTGTLKAFLSGRISYAMQFSGPSVVVDTACSSSLVALYQAVRALMNNDCNAALAGGVNVVTSPDMYLGLDRAHFLSPTGQCKAFDASADGYSRSEGCGLFVVKRLSDAIAENDNILGVIRGIEVNQNGHAHSITHPHVATQAALFTQLLEKSGTPPGRVNFVEAHGTGTQAGDTVEVQSIRSILAKQHSPANPLHVSSIKANIGHLEAAAGSAGLAKLLLMMKHRIIPPQISLKTLNPRIAPLETDNLVIDTTSAPWLPSHEGLTRVALLNNFGAAGSNAAALIEEWFPSSSSAPIPKLPFVFGVSAKSQGALIELKNRYVRWLLSSEGANLPLSHIAYTMTARRQLYKHRLAVTAESHEELVNKLTEASVKEVSGSPPRVALVFSGQGGQYMGMGKELYETCPIFKQHIDECHSILTSQGFPGILPIILAQAENRKQPPAEEFEAYQTAIFALEFALAKLWLAWGLKPSVVVGHSLGEYAAMVIANVLSLQGALILVAHRARLMFLSCTLGATGMMAVNISSSRVEDVLASSESFSETTIACFNSPNDCVVGGPISQLQELKKHFDVHVGCKSVILNVPFAYHTTAMQPLVEDLTQHAEQVAIHAPDLPIISNVHGDLIMPHDASIFNREYFARHCAEPVQFEKGIQSLLHHPDFQVDAWIEIGPHSTTLPMLKSMIPSSPLLASLRKSANEWATLTACLSQLYVLGVDLSWRKVFAHLTSRSCVSLPSYPFSGSSFWVPFKEEDIIAAPAAQITPKPSSNSISSLLGTCSQHPSEGNGMVAVFETPITLLAKAISGHVVGGSALCPASVYIEQVFAGVSRARLHLGLENDRIRVAIQEMEFVKPLVYSETISRNVILSIVIGEEDGSFVVSSRFGRPSEDIIHARGTYRLRSVSAVSNKLARSLDVVGRRAAAVFRSKEGQAPESFSKRTLYEVIFPRVVDYSKEYHTVKSLTVDVEGKEGYASVSLPADNDSQLSVADPHFVDTLLHVPGFIANLQGGINDAFICSAVGSVTVLPELVDAAASYEVYCSLSSLDRNTTVAEAYAVHLGEPRRVVAHLQDMFFRRLPLSTFRKGLAHAGGSAPPIKAKAVIPLQQHRTPSIPVDVKVLKIVCETCAISVSDIDLHTELETLGVDSLMSIEILTKIGETFPEAKLDAQSLTTCSNIINLISAALTAPSSDSSSSSEPSFPETRPLSPASTADSSVPPTPANKAELESDTRKILAEVLGLDVGNVVDDVDLESLGLDSLTSIEALHSLKSQFSLDFPDDFFNTHSTPSAVHHYISQRLQLARDSSSSSSGNLSGDVSIVGKAQMSLPRIMKALSIDAVPVSVQQSTITDRAPLFVLHDGSGLINYFNRLPPLERTVWGIHNPRFPTAKPWADLYEMASAYADYIMSITKEPVILGGWSFGGVASYEVSLQLAKKGVKVKGIVLIDSPGPVKHTPLSPSLIDVVVGLDQRNGTTELGRLMKSQFRMNASMLGTYDPFSTGGTCPPLVMLRSTDGFRPPGVDVPIWLADRSDPRRAVAGWDSVSKEHIKVIDIPGNHFQPFHPSHIPLLSEAIKDACAYIEGLQGSNGF